MIRAFITTTLLTSSLILLSACSSDDDVAAREAALASTTAQEGAMGAAHYHIRKALTLRDDISDYWLLAAQIASAQGNGQETFDAYRNVIALDRGNVDALRALCQLGSQFARARELDHFADQLAVLAPQDVLVLTAHGNAAMMRGNLAGAERFADQALTVAPSDPSALVLKGRLQRAGHKYDDAAETIKKAITTIGASPGIIQALADNYAEAQDRPKYFKAITDLAQADPASVDAALKLADLQYQDGKRDAARATVAAIAAHHDAEIKLADRLLALWLEQGGDALTPDQVIGDSAQLSPEMRAVYAQYANEFHRPDLAVQVLRDVADAPLVAATFNPKVALAEAMTLQDQRDAARAIVDAILKIDPTHPRALIARSRLLWVAGERNAAITDLRQVVAEDARNDTARILLAHALASTGETMLAMSALREGASANRGSIRIATALVRALIAQNKPRQAVDVLTDLARATPLNARAKHVRSRLCRLTGVATCDAPASQGRSAVEN